MPKNGRIYISFNTKIGAWQPPSPNGVFRPSQASGASFVILTKLLLGWRLLTSRQPPPGSAPIGVRIWRQHLKSLMILQ